MTRYLDTVWCDGCGAEIVLSPVVKDGHEYCCVLCQNGLACDCAALQEFEDERRAQAAGEGVGPAGGIGSDL